MSIQVFRTLKRLCSTPHDECPRSTSVWKQPHTGAGTRHQRSPDRSGRAGAKSPSSLHMAFIAFAAWLTAFIAFMAFIALAETLTVFIAFMAFASRLTVFIAFMAFIPM